MSSQPDHDDFDEEDEARDWFQREVAVRGLRIALETAIGVCSDSSSTSQAKANAASSIMRAAGVFDRKDESRRQKPIHELTAAELSREIQRLEKPSSKRERNGASDVFD